MTASPGPESSAAAPEVTVAEPTGAPSRSNWLAPAFACLVSLVLYLPTLDHELVYDDWFLINPTQNTSMRGLDESLTPAFNLFLREYWDGVNPEQVEGLRTRGQALYRPLTLFIWAVIQNSYGWVDGTQATPYHLVNVLLNMWVVYLVFALVKRLFGSTRLALLSSLLFAVHPLHSEAVAYVAGLSDMLSAATVLLGTLLWLKATEDRGRLRMTPYIGMLLTLFVGLLAKEGGVLVLAVIALTDVMLTLQGKGNSGKQRLAVYGGLIAVLAVHIFIRWSVMGYIKPDTGVIGRLDNALILEPFDIRSMNAFKLLAKGVWLFLWPQHLSVDYSFSAITVSRQWVAPAVLSGVVLIGMMLLVGLVKLKRSPAFGWGLLMFVGTALYTSNMFVPIGTIFGERLLYTPTIGACLAVAVLLSRLLGKSDKALAPLGLLVAVLVLGVLAVRTWERNKDFRSSLVLFEAAAKVVPDSGRVHYQLGALYTVNRLFDEAAYEFEEALRCERTFVQAAIQLGDVHMAKQVWDKAEQTYSDIIRGIDQGGSPGNMQQTNTVKAMVLSRRAAARQQMGDLEGAAADLQAASGLDAPGVAAGVQLAELLQGQQKWAESIPVLRNALQANPGDVRMLSLLCRAAATLGEQETYEEALQGLEATATGRALALAMRGEVMYGKAAAAQDPVMREAAMDLFEEALRLNDQLAVPFFFRGRFMVETQRAFYDAIVQYDRALEINPKHGPSLLYKALSQMQIQKFEEAIDTLKQLAVVDPGVPVYALMGEAYFMLGDVEQMEGAYAKLRELGEEPVQVIVKRVEALRSQGETEKALDTLNQAIVSPEFSADPSPWKLLGLLNLDAGNPQEALAAFDSQGRVYDNDQDLIRDPFLPLNRARTLIALDRDMEAAGELEQVDVMLAGIEENTVLWLNLRATQLLIRGQLYLHTGQAFFDPDQAESVCLEGMELTESKHPGFFDLSIEARLAGGDLPGAAQRARQAAASFTRLERFGLAAEALELAADGDRDGALEMLQAADDEWLGRLAERLQG